MTDLEWSEAPPRPELLARVEAGLHAFGNSLRVVARDLLGADARIDLVTTDPEGRITLVLLTTGDDDLTLTALALAQRAWVEARLADWIQLAPQLGLHPEGPIRVILMAPSFSPAAIAVARAADPEEIDLIRFRCVRSATNGSGIQVLFEPERAFGRRAPAPTSRPAGAAPATARFRSGLSDADLDLSHDERHGLD